MFKKRRWNYAFSGGHLFLYYLVITIKIFQFYAGSYHTSLLDIQRFSNLLKLSAAPICYQIWTFPLLTVMNNILLICKKSWVHSLQTFTSFKFLIVNLFKIWDGSVSWTPKYSSLVVIQCTITFLCVYVFWMWNEETIHISLFNWIKYFFLGHHTSHL